MLSLLNIDYSSMISTLPLDSGSSDSLSNFINNGLIGLVTEADTTYKIAGSVIALILALIGCFSVINCPGSLWALPDLLLEL